VHISRLRKVLNPFGIDIDINKTEYRQSDQSRYQLVHCLIAMLVSTKPRRTGILISSPFRCSGLARRI
jgi:hypothetical protein